MEQEVNMFGDVLIIGGGVVGTAIAHKLAEYDLRTFLVEKEIDLAGGTSKANSGIIHAGYNADMCTLKGRMHLKAVKLFPELCRKLHVAFKQIGSLVVAYSSEEMVKIAEMFEEGKRHQTLRLEIVDKLRLKAMEPTLNQSAEGALYAPTAGIIAPYELTFALAENAALNGVQFFTQTEVTGIVDQGEKLMVQTTGPTFHTKIVINAGGLYAERIAGLVEDNDFQITPRKGEYFLFDKSCGKMVSHVLFPVPSRLSKGILVTPTIDGNLLVGPNAEENYELSDTTTTERGLREVFEGGQKVLPGLLKREVINQFAGVRAVIKKTEDFHIAFSLKSPRVIHVAGIQSPGLTAAPGIAEYVIEVLDGSGMLKLRHNEDFAYLRKPLPRFSELSRAKQASLIAADPRYGQIICRCEQVTEAEIIDVITRPLGARTLGGVKRRVRAGMGRCQGGFCGPRIVELLHRYGGINKLAVTKEGDGSVILIGLTRGENNVEVGKAGEER